MSTRRRKKTVHDYYKRAIYTTLDFVFSYFLRCMKQFYYIAKKHTRPKNYLLSTLLLHILMVLIIFGHPFMHKPFSITEGKPSIHLSSKVIQALIVHNSLMDTPIYGGIWQGL